jgi:O-antigen biosynthesis protein
VPAAGPIAIADPAVPRVLFAPQGPRPLGPDASSDPARYDAWCRRREAERLSASATPPAGPDLTVLLLVDGAEAGALERTLGAAVAQTSDRWLFSVSIIGPPAAEVEVLLADALPSLPPGRATLRSLAPGTSVTDALGAALEDSDRPAFMLLDVGDVLAPDAVALLSAALVDADVAYADEDRVDGNGQLRTPLLKPAWSPTLFLSWRYTGRPVALRVAPVIAAGGFRPPGGGGPHQGDWEHDLLLRVTERTTRVAHVAEVLCHRPSARPPRGEDTATVPPEERGPSAVVAALARRGETADVDAGPMPGTWALHRHPPARPAVSAIVPFRDSTTLLRACADSLAATAGGIDLEVVLVDNGSVDLETATLLERLAARPGVLVRRDPRPFNWAALNNAAADDARGDVLLFLNDDVEARRPGWLEALAAQALRPEVGVAGARLLYPDGRVQHAGVVLGLVGISGHILAGLPGDEPGYLGMAVLTRDVSAVTGACMATRRDVFERLDGFDEALGLDFNDIDYCLRARRRGFQVVYEALAELVHHESPSRGTSGSVETALAFMARWGDDVRAGDPFLNPNLTRADFSAALAAPEEGRW